MKKFKLVAIISIPLIIVIVGLLIYIFTRQPEPKDIIFKIDNQEINLNVGDTYTLEFTIENLENYELAYTYNNTIIKIENNIITALSAGKCEVMASIKNQPNIEPIKLNVKVDIVKPEKIICETEVKIYINETYKLNIELLPLNADTTLQFISYDKNVAVCDENGVITGISEGEVEILVKSKVAQNIKISIHVVVELPPVEKIEAVEEIELTYDQTHKLEWQIYPLTANQEVSIESSNPEIADVTDKGLITAYKYGTATIIIKSVKYPNISKEIKIIVDGDKTTDVITPKDKITVQLGQTSAIEYTILPATAYQKLDIETENEEDIEINENNITVKKVGTFVITLKTVDNTNISKEIIIEVIGAENPIFITNDLFDKNSTISIYEKFDPLQYINAYDDKDGDITKEIIVTGEVDNENYGEYFLKYTIMDTDGHITTLDRKVIVTWDYSVTVIGHAGSYYGVPNSEEAILYAATVLKYPAIEIDLKQTKDGIFVLSHDPEWGGVSLEQTNYDDLKKVQYKVVKSAGLVNSGLTEEQRTYTATICTFERYLEICKQYNIIAVIELKTSTGISNWTEANAPHQSRMAKIMELIEKYDMLHQVVFLSGQELCLNWVKTRYEYIPCQYLSLKSCENETTYNIVKKYNLDISFNVRDGITISDEWLEKYRQLGCKLAVFTFEEYASYNDIQTWINRGVDFVTTDWHELDKLELPKNN